MPSSEGKAGFAVVLVMFSNRSGNADEVSLEEDAGEAVVKLSSSPLLDVDVSSAGFVGPEVETLNTLDSVTLSSDASIGDVVKVSKEAVVAFL